jgi:hypothetical protein
LKAQKLGFTEYLAASAIPLFQFKNLAATTKLGFLPLVIDMLIFAWVDDRGHTVIYPLVVWFFILRPDI